MTTRTFLTAALLANLATVVACESGAPTSSSSPSPPAATEHGDDPISIPASTQTTSETGVTTWGVDDRTADAMVVRGYDADGTTVVRFEQKQIAGARRTFVAALDDGSRRATLRISPDGDPSRIRIKTNDFAGDTRAGAVLARMVEDLKSVGSSRTNVAPAQLGASTDLGASTRSVRTLDHGALLAGDDAGAQCLTTSCGTSLVSNTAAAGAQTALTCASSAAGTTADASSACGSSVGQAGEAADAHVLGCQCGRSDAVTRAREWVAAKMPYCGGANGGSDVLCGGTCSRTGDAQKPGWDEYRSDCSGLVSYAWGLPAPGRTTSTLAPYDTSVSELTTFEALVPGDALNNDHHVMLFGGWTDKANDMAMVLEEYDCGQIARETETSVVKQGDSTVTTKGETYNAIKYKPAGT